MIRLNESDTEFFLYVPYQHKDRAKGIDGRRWDPERGCWAYPKTPRVFDAIVGEFGDELNTLSVARPQPVPETTPGLEAENTTLRGELSEIKETLRLLATPNKDPSQNEQIRRELAVKEQELQHAREELHLISAKLDQAELEARVAREDSDNLRIQLAAPKPKSKSEELLQTFLAIASEAAGENRHFLTLIKGTQNPERFPLDFAIALEDFLRDRLQPKGEPVTLFDLISQAEDAEILSRDAVDLAHIIRKQRNLFAHAKADSQTGPAREFLTLFAAALLWRDLQ